MTESANDPMWQEFRPLWKRIQSAGEVLVAGGYGLFLKQNWLLSNRGQLTVVRLDAWLDSAPRVTKDLDIVVGLEIVSSRDAQARISAALQEQGFAEKRPRWQFEKREGKRTTIVDLHSPLPEFPHPNLATDKVRVKHKPSLGDAGVHGRQNLEAAGCELHPFRFEANGLMVGVPNPVTWSVMKLCATRDRWRKAQDQDRAEEDRTFEREQAMKHARDVCRVVAMATRNEADHATTVAASIRKTAAFADAVDIRDHFFGREDGWGSQVAQPAWQTEDLTVIRNTLASWFGGRKGK
jgi:hypothetical protein